MTSTFPSVVSICPSFVSSAFVLQVPMDAQAGACRGRAASDGKRMPSGCGDTMTRKNLIPHLGLIARLLTPKGSEEPGYQPRNTSWECRRARHRLCRGAAKAERGTVLSPGTDTTACTGTGTDASAKQKLRCRMCPAVLELGKMFHGKHVCKNADLVTLFPPIC